MNSKKKFWIVLIYTIIALLFTYYFDLINYTWDAVLFYLIIPLILIVFIFKDNVRTYGVAKGDMISAVTITTLSILLVVIISYLSVKYIPNIRYYYVTNFSFNTYFVVMICVYMVAWEFILRGFTLHGIEEYLGFTVANVIQTILFFFAHYGKPHIEFISTLFTGLLFGYITKKTRTIWPMILIHIAIMISVVYFSHHL